MTDTTPTETAAARPLYLRLWANAPRELLAVLLSFLLSLFGFGLAFALVSAGTGTVPVLVGVVFLVGGLYVARFVGAGHLGIQRLARRPHIPAPIWTREPGFWGWARSLFGSGRTWLYLVHALVHFVLAMISFTLVVAWLATGLGGATSAIWRALAPESVDGIADVLIVAFGWHPVAGVITETVIGLGMLATLPFLLAGLGWADWGLARGLLGTSRTAALQREVANLTASRSAAVAAEGTALRRLERDIHDGPQQRLVRLQMDLAAAERQLAADPDAAARLIAEARSQSREALEELRALSRGFSPPILQDRGLVAALESLAVRSATTVSVASELPADAAVPVEVERNAYFIAAEALTNAVKHADAREVRVRVATSVDPATGGSWLDIEVVDDGIGGATAVPGHGIAGLQERAHGLGGTVDVHSPTGGPTRLVARLPLPAVATDARVGS